jgi:hypothetical protein
MNLLDSAGYSVHPGGSIMHTITSRDTDKYALCIAASRRVRWDIDKDLIRGRSFDFEHKFLPDPMSFVSELDFLQPDEQRLLSQIQGRTYANMFGLVERFINCKVLEVSADHWTGDQVALESLVRFSDEELKHQELFRRVETMLAAAMPEGYEFSPTPNGVAAAVLAKSTWAVLALTLLIELFTQEHYRSSIEPDGGLSPLFKDIFLFHWREESQHARLDELELLRHDRALSDPERDRAVNDLIDLVAAVDGILQAQAESDCLYFLRVSGGTLNKENAQRLRDGILKAYRWQYILSGASLPKFQSVMVGLLSPEQLQRVTAALEPLFNRHQAKRLAV